ncbi:DUF6350 family protein [Nocardia sp. NPDC050710]|uniref:cell division protein PerM n=1 Tax=Nocardia sp. NPDC050710 TaxID=3157220 RepID=UPI0033F26D37
MSSTRNSLGRRTFGSRGAPGDSTRRGRGADPEPGRSPRGAADEIGFLSLTPERARMLLYVAARPATVGLVAISVLMLGTLLTADTSMEGTSGAIAAGWLAVHQVPLVIGKTTLGLLPLLPTALLLWLTGRDCARAVEPGSSRVDVGWVVGAALAGPLLVTAVCLAVAEDASGVVALQPPNSLSAFGWVGGLHLVAAGAGIASRTRRRLFTLLRAPEWAVAGLYGAGRTVSRLLCCATAVTVVAFLAHWSRIGDTYQDAGNVAGGLGLTLLSLAYLPNVVVGTVGVLVGSGVGFGDASVGVFSVVGGPIPAVPVLAAVPIGPAAGWWAVLLLIPAAVGALGGLDAGRISTDRIAAPWATLTSAGSATLLLVFLGAVAGGDLGAFGRVGLDLPIFAVATFAWLAIAGYVGLVFARWFVVPVGAAFSGYDDDAADSRYADDDYDDCDHDYDYDHNYDHDYDGDRYDGDRYTGNYYDGDRYDDDRYDDDRYDDYYDGDDYADADVELEGELLDEQPSIAVRPARTAPPPDIVDAEVVETDSDDPDSVRRR